MCRSNRGFSIIRAVVGLFSDRRSYPFPDILRPNRRPLSQALVHIFNPHIENCAITIMICRLPVFFELYFHHNILETRIIINIIMRTFNIRQKTVIVECEETPFSQSVSSIVRFVILSCVRFSRIHDLYVVYTYKYNK